MTFEILELCHTHIMIADNTSAVGLVSSKSVQSTCKWPNHPWQKQHQKPCSTIIVKCKCGNCTKLYAHGTTFYSAKDLFAKVVSIVATCYSDITVACQQRSQTMLKRSMAVNDASATMAEVASRSLML